MQPMSRTKGTVSYLGKEGFQPPLYDGLPFEARKIPNQVTLTAMQEAKSLAEKGDAYTRLSEMFAELNCAEDTV